MKIINRKEKSGKLNAGGEKEAVKDKITEEIAIGSFWNFLLTLSARIGSLFFVIIIARALMPESYGIYSLAMAIALILLISIDAAINQSLLKYVSEAINKKDKKSARANFRYLFGLKLMITLGVSFLLIVLAYPLAFFIFKKPLLFLPLVLSGLYILVNSIGNFYSSYFYIIRKLEYVTYKQIIFEVLRIIGVLILFFVFMQKYHIIGVIGILIISMFIAVMFLLYNLRRINPFLFESSNEKINREKILKFSFYSGLIGSLLVIFGYIDTIMIGIFLPASYVGYYNAGLAIVIGVWGFLNLSHILLPILTGLQNEQIKKEFNKIFKYISMLAIPAIFGVFILGRYMIKFIYGEEYLPAVVPFYILSLLILIIPLIDLFTPLFSARNKLNVIIKGIIISTLINVFLNYILIKLFLKISPIMALAGAAIATLISQLFYLLFLVFYSRTDFDIHLDLKLIIKPVIASAVMLLALTLFNTMIDNFSVFIGILEIFFGIAIYFAVIILIKGVSKEDILLLKDVLRKFF